MLGKVRISPIFIFLLCLLIYCGWEREVACFLLAALLHECGHLLALTLCGCTRWRISFGLGGAAIDIGVLPYRREFFCAAAGPAVNLLLLLIPDDRLRLFNLLLLFYNLLPLAPLDGWRMLAAASGQIAPQYQSEICDAAEIIAAALLLCAGLFFAVRLPYGRLPITAAVVILLRTCIFRSEGLDKARFVG